ncbi:MAG: tetratricopeptide repeat protein [Desulfobacterales bacterium]|nr:tetratricopeptide repeat protein [Desulfobacterales bacterium]
MKKIIIYIILIINLFLYSFLSCKGNSKEEIYPEIINVKPFEATITWGTKKLNKGRIFYHPITDDKNISLAEESIQLSYKHEIILTGLKPSTRYTYWIDKSNFRFQFQTQPEATSPFSFILLIGNILQFDLKDLIISELPEFLFYLKPISEINTDSFKEIRPFLPIFYTQESFQIIQWGGLSLIIINNSLNYLEGIKNYLDKFTGHTIGIITNFEQIPSNLQSFFVDHNKINPTHSIAFILRPGSSLTSSDKNGIKYLSIPIKEQKGSAIRFDVDTEFVKANFIKEGKEILLKSPPLKQNRTCEECRRLADKGAYEESIHAYIEFIENHKGHFQLEDAYYAIGLIYDEKLFQFKDALSWYQRLINEYPGGTLSTFAKQRVKYLKDFEEHDFEPLSKFERIKKIEFGRQIQNIKAKESLLKQIEEIISKYPASNLAPVMQYWISNQYRQIYLEKAVESYYKLKKNYPSYEHAKEAMIDIGDTYYQFEKYNEAISAYEKALKELPALSETIMNQIKRCNRNILRDRLAHLSLGIIILFTLIGFFLKPISLSYKNRKLVFIIGLIILFILFIYGFIIHEQFSSKIEMYLFVFIIPIMASLSSWISILFRAPLGIIIGLFYFISSLYLIIYYINIHYLIIFKL